MWMNPGLGFRLGPLRPKDVYFTYNDNKTKLLLQSCFQLKRFSEKKKISPFNFYNVEYNSKA